MFQALKSLASVSSFILLITAPAAVMAQSESDLNSCLQKIKQEWPSKTDTFLEGNTRHNTPCQLSLKATGSALHIVATGSPLSIEFNLGAKDPKIEQTLLSCRVDKEKLHIVFEEKLEDSMEKRERTQMTLLKRHGKGLSLILAKREMRIFRPAQHTSLICHLN